MKRRFTVAVLLAACSLLPAAGRAQTVEFEVPEEISIVPGRLSVTFRGTVQEAEARALVADLGYDVAEVSFRPVVARAEAAEAPTEAQLARLRATPGVRSVDVIDRRPLLEEAQTTAGGTASRRPFEVVVQFESATSERQARRALRRLRGFRLTHVAKYANEITIVVGEGQDEAAIERLRKSKLVEDVFYLAQ